MGLLNFLHKTDIIGDRNQDDDDADFHSIFEIEDLDSLDIGDMGDMSSDHINKSKKPIMPAGQTNEKQTEKIDQNFFETGTSEGLKEGNKTLAECDQGLVIKLKTSIVWNNKGVVLTRLGKYAEAIEAYNQALIINPNYTNAWNNKGVVLTRLGKYTEAIKAYDHALTIDTDFSSQYKNQVILRSGALSQTS